MSADSRLSGGGQFEVVPTPGPDPWRARSAHMAMDGRLGGSRGRARRRRFKQLQIIFALALVAIMSLTAAALGAGETRARTTSNAAQPVQGIYEYCAPQTSSDGCVKRLSQIA